MSNVYLVPPVPLAGREGRLSSLCLPAALALAPPEPGQAECLAPQVPLVPAVGGVHVAIRGEVQRSLDRAVRQLCVGTIRALLEV